MSRDPMAREYLLAAQGLMHIFKKIFFISSLNHPTEGFTEYL